MILPLIATFALIVPVFSQSPPASCTPLHADICLALDTSRSVKDHHIVQLREALRQFTLPLNIGTGDGQVLLAAVTFGNETEVPFVFEDHTDKASLLDALGNLERVEEFSGTRTDLALQRCVDLFASSGRKDVQRITIVFTDGRIHPKHYHKELTSVIANSKSKNITALAVGIGSKVNYDELLEIADNKPSFVFNASNFGELANLTNEIVNSVRICSCVPECKYGVCNTVTGQCSCPPGRKGLDCSEKECTVSSSPIDMCVIIDTSVSIKDDQFLLLKEALGKFAESLDVGSGDGQVLVAAVTFGAEAENPFGLDDYTDSTSLAAAMRNLQRVANNRGTRTDLGLLECARLLETDGREEAEGLVVVFTDGKVFPRKHRKDLGPALESLRATKAKVIAVGIGFGIDENELTKIALNQSENVHTVANFTALTQTISAVVESSKICVDKPLVCKKDIVFVLDYSVTIKSREFRKIQKVVTDIVNGFDIIGTEGVRFGAVVYGFGAVQQIHLRNTTDKEALLNQINSIKRLQRYKGTRTANALMSAADMFANEGRPDLDHCIILITDGRATDPEHLPRVLQKLKSQNVSIFKAIGIGNGINRRELERPAGKDNVLIKPSFDDLEDVVEKIEQDLTCS